MLIRAKLATVIFYMFSAISMTLLNKSEHPIDVADRC